MASTPAQRRAGNEAISLVGLGSAPDAVGIHERGATPMQVKWTAKRPDLGPDWQVECGDQRLAVRVDSPEFDPHALERAVRESLGIPLDPPPSPPRFSIRETTSSHGDLFELEEDTIWTIYDGDRPFWQFKGGTSHDMVDGTWSAATGSHGCDFVVLGADGLHVLAGDRYDVTCHPCPL